MLSQFTINRRTLLAGAAVAAMLPSAACATKRAAGLPDRATALPLSSVRLLPSPFLEAVEANRAYLHRLEPDRLLHNFRTSAGLKPKGEVYGGWESDTIAGHTLGHYLTALSLMYAQTGDAECKRRVDYIVSELAEAQAAHGDGYVAGFTRKRGDIVEDGKALFPEIMAGDIRSAGFDLNGCWVPFYTWHKLYAGLFDAETYCGNTQALPIAVKLSGYIEKVFAPLNEEQVQKVLDCEHGGINESFAELYARTKDPRWMKLAQRLRHRKVLDPLSQRQDSLPWIHANTQIPKIIGLARIYELAGVAGDRTAAEFFWETVTRDYSYVIGGNADREYFPAPRTVSKHITEQTCESCNTYNMLKLTRHLYSWSPSANLFDYYERAHINHMLAHQNPKTGHFAYMVPLMSGTHRNWSSDFDDFWCCVGTGMETHSKHGESIYWQGGDTLIVNLFIPSQVEWKERNAKLRLDTRYPYNEDVTLTLTDIETPQSFAVALRIPGWCQGAKVAINGADQPFNAKDGYVVLRRKWTKGDRISLTLPMALRTESTVDDPDVIALLHGPVVLAADVGSPAEPYKGPDPALVSNDLLTGFVPVSVEEKRFRSQGVGRPQDLEFSPFYSQWDRRTAVYFRRFTDAGWKEAQVAFAAEQERQRELEARSVDIMHLGEMQPERDHQLEAKNSYPGTYRGRHGRDVRAEGFVQFRMKVRSGQMVLQNTYWGEERGKHFHILVDGQRIATVKLNGEHPGDFFTADYPIPEELTRGKTSVLVRFEPEKGLNRGGPVYGVRMLAAK
ncbi:glycoside hydrolase family 127 protein [Pedomonas mirosovicensis]|uniref:glycoside hydrolase family 127 protein n=1 Tax=Pedomonas mirosovicensis TaxID=2908641 RepID=UPI002168BBD2|nr:glycoside hydrolase family 127 protein [Pedomonas mirosovicensis]MCH8686581.1 glycoside hydrolase family 127 protein [Pedomonas mirosovicensis]